MKGTLKQEEVFTLEVGTAVLPNLRVKSRWNGFTELVDSIGQQVIIHGDKDGSAVSKMFSALTGEDKTSEITVLTASPDLAALLAAGVAVPKEDA